MATRIRLRRMGSNKRPFYRVVVADQRSPRDGRFIEIIGKYHPLNDPSVIEIDEVRALHWLMVGAQPSDQVRNLMTKVGIWDRFVSDRPGAAIASSPKGDRPERPKISKKAQAKAAEAAKEAQGSTAPEVEAPAQVEPTAEVEAPAEIETAPEKEPYGEVDAAAETPEEPTPDEPAADEPAAEEPSEG
jgi:small subunit ribosomal protein S16